MRETDYGIVVRETLHDTSMAIIGDTPVGMVKNFPSGDHKIYQIFVDIPFTSRDEAEKALKAAIGGILDSRRKGG